uniref:Uncharacterized protein n=1 Tax=Tetradesmus obliquus TaxID=3088 RepID=A0A383VM12_TETOB|eukprot:jgi/Sobl393_1/15439/SZX65859.1
MTKAELLVCLGLLIASERLFCAAAVLLLLLLLLLLEGVLDIMYAADGPACPACCVHSCLTVLDAAAEALERDTHCRHLLKIIRRVPPKEPAPQAKAYTAPVPMIVHRKAPVPQAKAYTAPAPAPELKATQPGRLLLNSNIIGRPRHTSSVPQAKAYTAPVPMIVHRKALVPQAKAYTAPAPAPELKATQPGRLLLNSNIIGRPRHTSSVPQAKAYTAPVPMIVHRKAPVPQAKAYTAPAPAPELKATQPGRRLLQEIGRVREPAPQAKVYTAPVTVPEIKKAPVP